MDQTLDYGQTMVGEQALMNALGALQTAERENNDLKREMCVLKKENDTLKTTNLVVGAGGGGNDLQVEELLQVNHQWDLEYKEQEEAFRRYRLDSQQAQSENQAYIAQLKQDKEYQGQEIDTLKFELSQIQKKMRALQQRNKILEDQLSTVNRQAGAGGGVLSSSQRVKQLEDDNALLRQQATAFKEDFEAERRDRERLSEEKQSISLRYEAEITSLKLQLDRCRNELSHYTTEATRLAQKLRLKHQYEDDQFKRHLESRGYVARSPNGPLPPLDPFVEHDPPSQTVPQPYSAPPIPRLIEPSPPPPTHTSPRPAPRKNLPSKRNNHPGQLLARSSDSEDSRSAPASFEQEFPRQQHFSEKPRSKTPTPSTTSRVGASNVNGRYPEPTYPANHVINPGNQGNGYIMQNGAVTKNSRQSDSVTKNNYDGDFVILDERDVQRVHSDGESINSSPVTKNRIGHVNRFGQPLESELEVKGHFDNPVEPVQRVPPTQMKGKHKCPRCARRFATNAECSDHKSRCIS